MVSVTELLREQYPHWLYARVSGGEAAQDEATGQWRGPLSGWLRVCRCREEANGKGARLETAGGEYVSFSSTVYLPQGAPVVEVGAEVAVSGYNWADGTLDDPDFLSAAPLNGSLRARGVCLRYDRGRLHSRLWV